MVGSIGRPYRATTRGRPYSRDNLEVLVDGCVGRICGECGGVGALGGTVIGGSEKEEKKVKKSVERIAFSG